VKICPVLALIIVFALGACLPIQPELPMTEVPADRLLQSLEKRRQTFTGLKAVASVQTVKKSRKRTLDSVGIVLATRDRIRIEAYGPMGQSLFVLVSDGRELLVRPPGREKAVKPGMDALEKLIGLNIEVQELVSVLSGNVPSVASSADVKAFCAQDGDCVLEIHEGDLERRVHILNPALEDDRGPRITSHDLYRTGRIVFRAHFEHLEEISHYLMPQKITIEAPDKKIVITVAYGDVEVNVPVSDEVFTLSDRETTGQP